VSAGRDDPAWRLALSAPAAARDRFAAALEPFADSIAVTAPDARGQSLIEAIATAAPNHGLIRATLALLSASLGLPEPEIAIARLPAADWLAVSKREFAPFKVGRLFIHGSDFRGRTPAGCAALAIDAGTAFGTGRHESTQGCLVALQDLARSRRFANVLDLGCGCGILALAAARLWPAKALACDVDAEAVAVARQTIAGNGLAARVRAIWSDGPWRRFVARRAPYDLIAANIVPAPLLVLAPGLARALAPGGVVVLSGMLAGEAVSVERRYRALGLRRLRRVDIGSWRTLVFMKPGRRSHASRLVPARPHP
jgi:ribosomal protein L11 methyltransferase